MPFVRIVMILIFCRCVCNAQTEIHCPDAPSRFEVEHGIFTYRPGINFALDHFAATMQSRGKRLPMCLTKTTIVEHGEVTVRAEDLNKLFQRKLEHSSGEQKLSDVKLEMKDNEVLISGTAHKGMPIHFSIQGPVDAVAGRSLRIHARKVSVLGIPVKGLLEMIGMQVGSIVHPGSSKGVVVQENSLFFDPEDLGHIVGHIVRAEIKGDRLDVAFGKAPKRPTQHSGLQASVPSASQ